MTMNEEDIERVDDALATPLLSSSSSSSSEFSADLVRDEDQEGTGAEVWDVIFDKDETIGLQTRSDRSTQLVSVQRGSQAERLGLAEQLRHGDVFIIGVNGKPVYKIASILKAVDKCRQQTFLARALVFTFARQALRPPPVCQPCWTVTKFIAQCVPVPNRSILTCRKNNKFLGLCRPAKEVQQCSCWCLWRPLDCKTQIRLETIVCLLAWLLLVKSFLVVVFFTWTILDQGFIYMYMNETFYFLAHSFVEGCLALYLLRGMVARAEWAVQRFALMLFVETVAYFLTILVLVGLLSIEGIDPEELTSLAVYLAFIALTIGFKFYLMWTAWSLANEYKRIREDHNDENNENNENHENNDNDNADRSDARAGEAMQQLRLRLHGPQAEVPSGAPNDPTTEDESDEESGRFSLA